MNNRTTTAALPMRDSSARYHGSVVIRTIRSAAQALRTLTTRQSFVTTVLAGTLLLSASCVMEKKQQMANAAQTSFTGTWRIEATEPPSVANGARYLLFRPDGRYAALDSEKQQLWAGTYEIDPTQNPPIFDHRSDESMQSNGDALGIYRLSGDRLTFACVVGTWREDKWTGRQRPAHFVIGESDAVLHLQRVASE